MADRFASSKVSTRKTRRHLVAFHNQRNWGRLWQMEQKISGISKFPEKRTTSRGEPKFSKRTFGKCLFHSILNRNFQKFWSNGTRPLSVVPFFSPFAQTTAFVRPTFARPVFFAPLSTDYKKTKGLLVVYQIFSLPQIPKTVEPSMGKGQLNAELTF